MAEQLKIFLNEMVSAYRKSMYISTYLSKLIDSWKYGLDDDNFAGTLLIDLLKVFDYMPIGLLIAKLNAHGLSNDASEYINSYLCDIY